MTPDVKSGHRPCPGCGSTRDVYVRQIPTGMLQVYCRKCGYTLDLITTLPCSPSAIIDEWDRRAVR